MDMKELFIDFKKSVDEMTDDDIKESIYNAIEHSRADEFIKYIKDEYGITARFIESDNSDTFEKKIFRGRNK